MKPKIDYRQLLLKELETRRFRNPKYGMSSFARLLGITPSRLSEVLRKKAGISTSKANDMARALKLNDNDREFFLDLVRAEHGRSPRERAEALVRVNKRNDDFFQFDIENFKSIADWYHHAIVELISSNKNITPTEISRSLGLDLSTVSYALDRLMKLEIIEKDKNHGYIPMAPNRETPRDVPSEAIKLLNEQILDKASKELRLQDVSERDFSVSFFNFSKEQMPLAKERIREFKRNFMKEFEGALGTDSVYCTSIQFFELTGKDRD